MQRARRDREQGGSPRILGISNLTHASLTVDRRTRSCTSASHPLRRASNTLRAVWQHVGFLPFRLATVENPADAGLGSTDVHTISHETTGTADLVPHRHRELPRWRLRLQVHHQYTTIDRSTMVPSLQTLRVPDLHTVPGSACIVTCATARPSRRFIKRTSWSSK